MFTRPDGSTLLPDGAAVLQDGGVVGVTDGTVSNLPDSASASSDGEVDTDGGGTIDIDPQTASTSDALKAQPMSDRVVVYNLALEGVAKPITWGLDLAWLSEDNIRRGIAFMGKERVDVVRSSFMPTNPLAGNKLQGDALRDTNLRLAIIERNLPASTQVVLNSDHPRVDASLAGNAANWASLIDITTRMHQDAGRTVIAVSPMNEPDNAATGQGTIDDFYAIAGELNNNPRFDNIRISGGNTLNDDQALYWYSHLKDRLDEGNTHQLAGSFASYATFYQTVSADGRHATNDELHNVMEAMVGVEYGLQTGIWWGTAERARAEFVKASDGMRLGYAEHRPNWTAASVYRGPDGLVRAFGGTSERQAATTTYRFVSKDRDVYYDGQGPQREYSLTLPGGTGYQKGQSNAERVVDIRSGDDVPPPIDGRYVLVNRHSHKVLEIEGGATNAGAALQQGSYAEQGHQKWEVHPVDARVGGDFSYYTLKSIQSGLSPDVLDWSLDDGARIIAFNDTKGGNQQWYLEYVEDGWFYVRSRHSARCLDLTGASTDDGAKVVQWEPLGRDTQQWRFLPLGAPIEFDAPSAPTGLIAVGNAVSIFLRWSESPEPDVVGYSILRSEGANGEYETIARGITSSSFVDNSVTVGQQYTYVVRAEDASLNRSARSNRAAATASGEPTLVAHLSLDENLRDASENLHHAASLATIPYAAGRVGAGAATFDGNRAFLQLSPTIANHAAITIAAWVRWNGGAAWQRIFDFGDDPDHCLFLTPNSDARTLRFVIKDGGAEQRLEASALPSQLWAHVAVTLDATGARLYVNGQSVADSSSITLRPSDIRPVSNYIGRSQWRDPLFAGSIDDFRVYNYALSAADIAGLAAGP